MRLKQTLVLGAVFASGVAVAVTAAAWSHGNKARAAFSAEQLDTLVAPVALYPDSLLGEVLVASTYPAEIAQAGPWVQKHGAVDGAELPAAAREQPWDASVQALAAFPDVLAKLGQDLDWTSALGRAYRVQPADVMAAVQRLRARARASGKLASTAQQKVTTRGAGWDVTIVIEPADPQYLYVPVYNPLYVWGPAVWGVYPALVYGDVDFAFGPAVCLGDWFDGWGWYPNWAGHGVAVDRAFVARNGFAGGGAAGHGGGVRTAGHAMGTGHGAGTGAGARTGARAAGAAQGMASRNSGSAQRFGGGARSFGGGGGNFGGGAARSFSGGARSFSGGAARSFSGGVRSFSGGARNFGGGAARSFSGGARSFSGGARSFSGGARSFSGGARSFSGARRR